MGVDRARRAAQFNDGATVTGSFGTKGPTTLAGHTRVSTTIAFGGTVTLSGRADLGGGAIITNVVTLSGVLTVNTPLKTKAASASVQFCGLTAIGCGAASAVVSTTAVKSNAIIQITPIFRNTGISVVSGSIYPSCLCVTSITEGASFVIGWASGVGAVNAMVDAAWEIKLQA